MQLKWYTVMLCGLLHVAQGFSMDIVKDSVMPLESREYQSDLVKKIKIGGIYQHSKNKHLYKVITISRDTRDLSWHVVYEALYDNPVSTIWSRPLEMFLQEVLIDGESVPRFIFVE